VALELRRPDTWLAPVALAVPPAQLHLVSPVAMAPSAAEGVEVALPSARRHLALAATEGLVFAR
jgi:hypothetical protein